MGGFRAIIFLLLLAAGGCFAWYAYSGEARYRRMGLVILKWTLIATLGFFLVLFVDRLLS